MTSITGKILLPTYNRACGLAFVFALILPVFAFGQKKLSDEILIEKCWEYRYEGTAEARLASDGHLVFMVRDGSVVEAVSTDGGTKAWSSDLGGTVDSNLLMSGSSIILVRRAVTDGSDNAESTDVRSLSVATGVTRWNTPMADSDVYSLGTIGDQVLAFSQSGFLQGFGLADGVGRWNRKFPSPVGSTPVFGSDKVYFVTEGKQVSSVSAGGEPTIVGEAQYAVSALGGASDTTLAWGDERGNLTLFGIASGKNEWQFKSGARISEIVRVDGLLLAASYDNFVYAISPGSGNRVWKKRVASRIQSLQAVGDDTVLIQTMGEHNLIFVHAKNGKTAGQIMFNEAEYPVTTAILGNNRVAVLTDTALYLYGLGTCSSK